MHEEGTDAGEGHDEETMLSVYWGGGDIEECVEGDVNEDIRQTRRSSRWKYKRARSCWTAMRVRRARKTEGCHDGEGNFCVYMCVCGGDGRGAGRAKRRVCERHREVKAGMGETRRSSGAKEKRV